MLEALRTIALAIWALAGVPHGDDRMTRDELRALAADTGFPDPKVAAAIAEAESEGKPGARGDHGRSLGLWQIHTPSHPNYRADLLLEADYNALAAYEISSGGRDWSPWSTYRDGRYRAFLK